MFPVGVCGGFSDGGLPEACCWPEAFGMMFAKLAWDRSAFGEDAALPDPPEGKQNFEVSLDFNDVEGDAGKSVLCSIRQWQTSRLLLAAGWSSLAVPAALVGPAVQGVQLDWSATSPRLSDKTVFGFYSRVAPPDDISATHLGRLLVATWGYRRFLIAYDGGDYGAPLFSKFSQQLPFDVDTEAVALPEKAGQGEKPVIRQLLKAATRRQMRIGVMFVLNQAAIEVFAEPSFGATLLGPGYLWLGVPDLVLSGIRDLTTEEASRFMGTLTLGPEWMGRQERIDAFEAFVTGLALEDVSSPLLRAVLPCNSSGTVNLGESRVGPDDTCWWGGLNMFRSPRDIIDQYTLWAFDAVSMLHYTVNRLLATGTALSDIAGSTLLSALRETSFEGLTGRVSLDERGDRVPAAFSLTIVLQDGSALAAGSYDPVSGAVSWSHPPTFSDGTENRPEESFPPCAAGSFRNSATLQCTPCEAGTHAPFSGSTSCLKCSAGEFVAVNGASTCTPCPLGSYQQEVGQQSCEACSPGTYAQQSQGSECVSCPPGAFTTLSGASACDACPVGSYAVDHGRTLCDPCANSAADGLNITQTRLEVRGVATWVALEGAKSAETCGCSQGTFEMAGECAACSEGIRCKGMNEVEVELGYFASADRPTFVFACYGDFQRCPGGTPGVCAEGRLPSSIACTACAPGYRAAGGGACEACGGIDFIPFLALLMVASAGLLGMYRAVTKGGFAKQNRATVLVAITGCQFVTVIQQMGVLGAISFDFPEPLRGMLSIMQLLNFNLDILHLDCLGQISPEGNFALRLFLVLGFFGAVLAVHVAYVSIFCQFDFRGQMPVLTTAVGTIFMAFFLSISSSALVPFHCRLHPNGITTVHDYHGVICFNSAYDAGRGHENMVILGLLACSMPVAFLTWVTYAVLEYPKRMRSGDVDFLGCYAFLFFRLKEDRHWYALFFLVRNLAVAIIPVMQNTTNQLVLMQIVSIISFSVTLLFYPWRILSASRLDGMSTGMFMMVIHMCSLLYEDSNSGTIAILCCIILSMTIALFIVVSLFCCWERYGRRSKPYQYFICHHKAGAGNLARLLKIRLMQSPSTTRGVFVDSDDLRDLSLLFGYVANDTETLVVLCSQDILRRPWCMGEVTTASFHQGRVVRVMLPDFRWPEATFIHDYSVHVPDVAMLTKYGISEDAVKSAISWLFTCPAVELEGNMSSSLLRQLTAELQACTKSNAGDCVTLRAEHAQRKAPKLNRATTNRAITTSKDLAAIVLDIDSSEALCAGLCLEQLLAPRLQEIRLQLLEAGEDLPGEAAKVCLMCSKGAFHSAHVRRSLLAAAVAKLGVLPVVVEAAFRFPTETLYEALDKDPGVVSVAGEEYDGGALAAVIREIFTEIAVEFNPQESEEVLHIRAAAVASRLGGPLHKLEVEDLLYYSIAMM